MELYSENGIQVCNRIKRGFLVHKEAKDYFECLLRIIARGK